MSPADRPDVWRGALSWEEIDDGWWRAWRLDREDAEFAYADDLLDKAQWPAGVRMVTRTDAQHLTCTVRTRGEMSAPADLIIDGELADRQHVGPGETRQLDFTLPGRPVTAEFWLPHTTHTEITAPQLADGKIFEPAAAPAVRWVTYGSSITHCRAALGPTETWPALVARRRGWNLACLGFDGQCHLDATVARTLAAEPADLISLCLGINVYGAASYGLRTWPGRVADFVRTVRVGHPTTPIAVITPIISPHREETPNAAGLTLSRIRTLVTDVITDLRDSGDKRLHLLDGLTVLGTADAHLLDDGLHPGPEGYHRMAERLGPALDAVWS